MTANTPKRFIAGAACPQCKQVDKVVMYRKDALQYRECVECGYQDVIDNSLQFRELETRVNRTPQERQQAVQVLTLFDPDTNT